MEIAIIGTGSVGATLGRGWTAQEHTVVYGSRTPEGEAVQSLVADVGDSARATTPAEAARAGDAVLLAVPGSNAAGVVAGIAGEIGEKPLLDATNSMERTDEALAERVAEAAPEAHVVKAFNTIGVGGMRDPEFQDGRATMFLAGHASATPVAADLARDLGFEVVDCGDLSVALMLEDLARLWIHLSDELSPDIAFKLLRD